MCLKRFEALTNDNKIIIQLNMHFQSSGLFLHETEKKEKPILFLNQVSEVFFINKVSEIFFIDQVSLFFSIW